MTMGVISCDRKGCPNVMCGRKVLVHLNICDSCWEELVALKGTWEPPMRREEMEIRISNFMGAVARDDHAPGRDELNETFNELTDHGRSRWDQADPE
jgi:hypothetical protein